MDISPRLLIAALSLSSSAGNFSSVAAQPVSINGKLEPRLLELRIPIEAKIELVPQAGAYYQKNAVVVGLAKADVRRSLSLSRLPGSEIVKALWLFRYYDSALDDDPFTAPYPLVSGPDRIRGSEYPRVQGWIGPDRIPGSSPVLLETPTGSSSSRIVLRDASEAGDCAALSAYWRKVENDADWTRREEAFANRVGRWMEERKIPFTSKNYAASQISPLVPLIAEKIEVDCTKIEQQHKLREQTLQLLGSVAFIPLTGYAVTGDAAQDASDNDVRGKLRALGAKDDTIENLLRIHKMAESYLQNSGVLRVEYTNSINPESKAIIASKSYTVEQSSLIPFVLKALVAKAIPLDTGGIINELSIDPVDMLSKYNRPIKPGRIVDFTTELGTSTYFEIANTNFDYETNRGLLASYVRDPTSLMQYATGLSFLSEQRLQRIESVSRDAINIYKVLREEQVATSSWYESELRAPEGIHVLTVEASVNQTALQNSILLRARSVEHFTIILDRAPPGPLFEGARVRLTIGPPDNSADDDTRARSWALAAMLADPAVRCELRAGANGELTRIDIDASKSSIRIPSTGVPGMTSSALVAALERLGASVGPAGTYALGRILEARNQVTITAVTSFDK